MAKKRSIRQNQALFPEEPPARYGEWLAAIFDEAELADVGPGVLDPPAFDADGTEIARLFTWTMLRCGTDLAGYSDNGVGTALNWLLNLHAADFFDRLRSPDVPLKLRHNAVLSLKHLYRDCFEQRCPSVLALQHESEGWPLQHICFMLWDVSPLAYWTNPSDGEVIYVAGIEVMDFALKSLNDAVVESGLHGLGHTIANCRIPRCLSTARSSIDRFLVASVGARPELLNYARAARTGCVQ